MEQQQHLNDDLKYVIDELKLASLNLECGNSTSIEIYTQIHELFKKGLRITSPIVNDNELKRELFRLFSDDGSDITTNDNLSTSARILAPSSTVCSTPHEREFFPLEFLVRIF